jgi:hypothetical protein
VTDTHGAEWFYAIGGEQRGPVDDADVRAMLASGRLNADSLVWRDGMAQWSRLGDVPEFAARPPPPPPPPPPPHGSHAEVGYYAPGHDAQLQSKASTAITVGIISIVLSACVCAPAGLALGIWAWNVGKQVPDGYAFSAQARTGVICGMIGTIIGGLSVLLGILWLAGMFVLGV